MARKRISNIVYVSTGVIADAYLSKLRVVATKLQIRLFIYDKGFLSETFVKDWSNMVKAKTSLNESGRINKQNGARDNDDNDDDNDNDDDDDDDDQDALAVDEDIDDGDDECERFIRRMMKPPKSKNSQLYKRPKIKPARDPQKYFDLTKYNPPVVSNPNHFSGEGVVTRSGRKREINEEKTEIENEKKEEGKNKRKKKNETAGQTTAVTKGKNDEKKEEEEKEKEEKEEEEEKEGVRGGRTEPVRDEIEDEQLVSIERSGCPFDEYTVIVADDLLCSKINLKDEKAMKTNYVKNVCFLESLATRDCHRFSLHLVVTTQSSIGGTGNSMSNQSLRTLRANVDGMVLFPAPSRDVRAIISSLFTGDHYQTVKAIYKTQIEQSNFYETPSDERSFRPYVFLLLNMLSDKNYRYR